MLPRPREVPRADVSVYLVNVDVTHLNECGVLGGVAVCGRVVCEKRPHVREVAGADEGVVGGAGDEGMGQPHVRRPLVVYGGVRPGVAHKEALERDVPDSRGVALHDRPSQVGNVVPCVTLPSHIEGGTRIPRELAVEAEHELPGVVRRPLVAHDCIRRGVGVAEAHKGRGLHIEHVGDLIPAGGVDLEFAARGGVVGPHFRHEAAPDGGAAGAAI
mmetsp:Transcript_67471/g.213560  ORF Transcript_67471/g.213560 Transcript_67471/m.213560 type:complete len:216 (+) Transcript_67471:298-945(+)